MLWKRVVEFGMETVSIGWGLFTPKQLSLSLNVCQRTSLCSCVHTSLCSCVHTSLCGLQITAFLGAYASLPSLGDLVQELVARWTCLLLPDDISPGHAPSPVHWGSPVFLGVLDVAWSELILAHGRIECGLLCCWHMWHPRALVSGCICVCLAGRAVLG